MKTRFSLALVTGASSGIGEALCRLLAEQGINLLITGRNSERLNQLSSELQDKVDVTSFTADLRFSDQRELIVEKIHHFAPDLVINNAGYGLYGPILSRETSESMDMFAVNATAVTELSIAAARVLLSAGKKGTIINISSVAGFLPFPNFSMYASSKAYVTRFSECFDAELRSKGVRVLAACPGQVATRFRYRAGAREQMPARAGVMTMEVAANEIWWQIQAGRGVYTFNLPYRLALFAVRYLIPRKLLIKILGDSIYQRIGNRPLIKVGDDE